MREYKLKENLLSEYIQSNGEYKNYSKLMAEYISTSETIRKEILKEKNPFLMLDKSLLCISLMTGDREFYKQNKDRLIEIINNWDYTNNSVNLGSE